MKKTREFITKACSHYEASVRQLASMMLAYMKYLRGNGTRVTGQVGFVADDIFGVLWQKAKEENIYNDLKNVAVEQQGAGHFGGGDWQCEFADIAECVDSTIVDSVGGKSAMIGEDNRLVQLSTMANFKLCKSLSKLNLGEHSVSSIISLLNELKKESTLVIIVDIDKQEFELRLVDDMFYFINMAKTATHKVTKHKDPSKQKHSLVFYSPKYSRMLCKIECGKNENGKGENAYDRGFKAPVWNIRKIKGSTILSGKCIPCSDFGDKWMRFWTETKEGKL